MLITPTTEKKGQTVFSKEKVRRVSSANFHFASAAQLDEYIKDAVKVWVFFFFSIAQLFCKKIQSEYIRKDNIQIRADLEDQVQERGNLERGCFISKFKVAAPRTRLPGAPITANCLIGIHLSN